MKTKTGLQSKTTKTGYRILAPLTLSAIFALSSSLFSADIPLEKLLDADVGVCIRFHDSKKRMEEFHNSAFYAALKKSKFYEKWTRHKSHSALETSLKRFEEKTGHSFEELIDDFVGESVCLAFSPDRKNPQKTVAIFLTRAKSPQHIDKWLEIWKKEQPDFKRKNKHFRGQGYSIRIISQKVGNRSVSKNQYYTKLGNVFALTDTEEDLQQLIGRFHALQKSTLEKTSTQRSLHQARWFRSAIENLSKNSFCQIVVNPRVWDGTMERKATPTNFFSTLWKSSDTLAVGFQFQHGPVVEAYVGYRYDNLPKDWQNFIERSEGENKFLKHIPSNAIFFGSGRHDLSLIVRSLLDVASSTEGRKLLGYFQAMDLAMKGISRFEKLLPALKNNWGAFLVVRDSRNGKRIPLDGLIALEVPKSKFSQTQMASRLLLEKTFQVSFEAISRGYNNKKPAEARSHLNSEQTKDGKLTWIESIGSYNPAFAMTSRYLLVSGSPNLIRNHLGRKAGDSIQANPTYRKISQIHFPNFSQILFLNTSELVSLLDKNEEYFSRLASRSEAITSQAAKKRLAAIQDFFGIFEAIFITMNVERTGFKLTFGSVRTGPLQ